MWVFVLSVSLALGFSFLCSLMEACLLSLSTSDMVIFRALPDRRRNAAFFRKTFKSRLLILITIRFPTPYAAGASFAEAFKPKGIGMFTLVFSLVMIQYTELLLKTRGVGF